MLYWDSNPIKSLLWSFSGFVIFWVRVWVCACVREDQCYFTHPCEPKWDYVIYWCVAVHEFIYTCIFKIRRDDKHTYTYTHLNFPSMHLNGSIHIQMRPNIRLSFPVCIYCCICITRANIYIYIKTCTNGRYHPVKVWLTMNCIHVFWGNFGWYLNLLLRMDIYIYIYTHQRNIFVQGI